MRVGLLFSHRNPPPFAVPWPRLYEETLEQVVHAEELGFDAAFASEHHFSEDGYSPSMLPILASWATRTTRIKLGTYVALLPLQHPLRFAEDAATVDVLSGGRLILGLGVGYRDEEFRGLGVPKAQSGKVMDEALEVLLRAWTEERFSFRGEHFSYEDVALSPRPVQQPRPPVWVGSPGRAGVRRVARWGLEGFAGAPDRAMYQQYMAKCAEFGTKPVAESQIILFGHVHPDANQAWSEAAPYARYLHQSYREWARAAGNDRTFRGMPRDDLVIGNPAVWLERVRQAMAPAAVPPTYLVAQLQLPGMPHEMVLRAIELFAREVLPALRGVEG